MWKILVTLKIWSLWTSESELEVCTGVQSTSHCTRLESFQKLISLKVKFSKRTSIRVGMTLGVSIHWHSDRSRVSRELFSFKDWISAHRLSSLTSSLTSGCRITHTMMSSFSVEFLHSISGKNSTNIDVTSSGLISSARLSLVRVTFACWPSASPESSLTNAYARPQLRWQLIMSL